MCIVVDTNVFSIVFDTSNLEHIGFEAVRNWIYTGKGKLVIGGSTYHRENIANSKRNRAILAILKNYNKVHEADGEEVDKHETRIRKLIKDKDFDDPHIAAIICTSGCKLIASKDERSTKYLKRGDVYKGHASIPKFYISSRNSSLLADINIAECCKPIKKVTKAQKEKLGGL